MTTLISVGNSEGGECDCVCGGRNHGVGLKAAVDNTRELGERWLGAIAEREGRTVAELKASLFGKPAAGDLFAAYREGAS